VGYTRGQPLEKTQELFVAMARVAAPHHLAGGNVESCEECRRAVTNIVVAASFDLARSHGQQRLGPVQRLDLTLSHRRRGPCFFGWMQVETNDVGDLVHEVGIRAELETARAMGLQTVILPNSQNGAVADAEPRPEQARAPMGAAVLSALPSSPPPRGSRSRGTVAASGHVRRLPQGPPRGLR